MKHASFSVVTDLVFSKGIQDLWGEERHCSLVSRGCTLIRFPKSHLFEMMDFETVKSLKRCLNLERYPADEELSKLYNMNLVF